ncbi:parathyroid hormone/parathyroid hormone-related peptide receptor-like [Gigantopelta aegis]|uniref:parathyroid hormone/parathyroid hormone-related peptide receptor-like n=1 Tax=Gigantopelta aegis TaxID=1735272 RepID=UPI001B887ED6|nr:parathyroid hormone/parathyroid hormone-related peptide receptor-like [Gigantopelta aegis]
MPPPNPKQDVYFRCLCNRYCLMSFTVLIGIIFLWILPLVGRLEKKTINPIVSVMSVTEQRKKLLRKKVDCFWRMKESENETLSEKEVMCPVWWDDLLCWNESAPDTLVSQECPDYVNGFNKNEKATKYCTENGTWEYKTCMGDTCENHTWTNFSLCSRSSIDLQFHTATAEKLWIVYTTGYSVSLAALTVAVVIMFCCKGLRCKSNILHINLFLSFILRALVSFVKDFSFVGNVGLQSDVRRRDDGTLEFIESGPHWECKILFSVFNYTISASLMWIFIEGLYLHMLIYRPLSTERRGVRFYIVLGWVLPMPFLIAWVIVKYLWENSYCWNIQLKSEYFWILKAPGVAVILLNFFFFLDILRILFLRARTNQRHITGRKKYRKLAKFILVLMPLFGVMYIVFYVAFPTEFRHEDYNVAYLYMEMGYNSFQGFVLALLFCFLNEEVHSELKRIWYRHQSRRTDMATLNRSFGRPSSWKKSSSRCSISPPLDRRHQHRLCKMGSTTSYEQDTDKCRKNVRTRAIQLLTRQDAIDVPGEITTVKYEPNLRENGVFTSADQYV